MKRAASLTSQPSGSLASCAVVDWLCKSHARVLSVMLDAPALLRPGRFEHLENGSARLLQFRPAPVEYFPLQSGVPSRAGCTWRPRSLQ